MEKIALVQQDQANASFARALRLRVGLGKPMSFAQLAEVSGLSERTLRAYADMQCSPPLHAVLSICSALGAGFASDILGPAGMAAQLTEADEPDHQRAVSCLARMAGDLSEALEDGHVDHRERALLRAPAQRIVDLMLPIANGAENVVPARKGAR